MITIITVSLGRKDAGIFYGVISSFKFTPHSQFTPPPRRASSALSFDLKIDVSDEYIWWHAVTIHELDL